MNLKRVVPILLLGLGLVACGPSLQDSTLNDSSSIWVDPTPYYDVHFDSQGGSEVASQRIREGNVVRRPDNPTKDDFIFQGWYQSLDDDAEEWDFHIDRVLEDFTLYAFWMEDDQLEPTLSLTYERNDVGYTVTGSGQEEVVIIPEEYDGLPVTEIGESAFSYAHHSGDVTSIVLPDTITTIGRNAFHNRANLVSITIGENSQLTTIGNNAFSGNSSLPSIFIPARVTSIGDSAFNNCGSLNEIMVDPSNSIYSGAGNNLIEKSTGVLIRGSNQSVIPAEVVTIAQAAFRRAATITELIIPLNVRTINNYIIADSAITQITYLGTTAQWELVTKGRMWNYSSEAVVICSDTVS